MNDLVITVEDPTTDDVRRLLERHLAFAHEQSPPEDVHALDSDGLKADDLTFFTARSAGELVGVGALRRIDDSHAEIKSMHTAESARGGGVGREMIAHLLEVARLRGCSRVSLETGTVPAFAPARSLYASVGFAPCEPFGSYRVSAYSVCMTLTL